MKSKTVVLAGFGETVELIDAFYSASGSPKWLSRVPPLDEACDDMLSDALTGKSGAVLLCPCRQLDKWVKRFLSRNRMLPVLFIAVTDSPQPENGHLKILDTICSQLAEIGITNVRVELACYDQQRQGFLKTDVLCEQMAIFQAAITHFDRFPGVIFCPSRSAVSSYVDAEERIRNAKDSFLLLNNLMTVSATIEARKLSSTWGLRVISVLSDRLKFEGCDLLSVIQEDLARMVVSNEGGRLFPLMIQEGMRESVERWLALRKIKSVCDLTLTIVCPDEVTRFNIQQSPVQIKVGEVDHE